MPFVEENRVKSHASRKIVKLGNMRYAYFVLRLLSNPQVQQVVHPTWRQPEIDSLLHDRIKIKGVKRRYNVFC